MIWLDWIEDIPHLKKLMINYMIKALVDSENEYYQKYGCFSFWSDSLKVKRIKEQKLKKIKKV